MKKGQRTAPKGAPKSRPGGSPPTGGQEGGSPASPKPESVPSPAKFQPPPREKRPAPKQAVAAAAAPAAGGEGVSRSVKRRAKQKARNKAILEDCPEAVALTDKLDEFKAQLYTINTNLGSVSAANSMKAANTLIAEIEGAVQEAKKGATRTKAIKAKSSAEIRRQIEECEAIGSEEMLGMSRDLQTNDLPVMLYREAVELFSQQAHVLLKSVEDKKGALTRAAARDQENAAAAKKGLRLKSVSKVEKAKTTDPSKLMAEACKVEISEAVLQPSAKGLVGQLFGGLSICAKVERVFGVLVDKGDSSSGVALTITGVTAKETEEAAAYIKALNLSCTKTQTFDTAEEASKALSLGRSMERKHEGVLVGDSGPGSKSIIAYGPSKESVQGLLDSLLEVLAKRKTRSPVPSAAGKERKRPDNAAPRPSRFKESVTASPDFCRVVIGQGGAQVKKFEKEFDARININLDKTGGPPSTATEEEDVPIVVICTDEAKAKACVEALKAFFATVQVDKVPASKEAMGLLYRGTTPAGKRYSELRRSCGLAVVRKEDAVHLLAAKSVASAEKFEEVGKELREIVEIAEEAAKSAAEEKSRPRAGTQDSTRKKRFSGIEKKVDFSHLADEGVLSKVRAKIIGQGGATVKRIMRDTNATLIRVDKDTNTVTIAARTEDAAVDAEKAVNAIIEASVKPEEPEAPAAAAEKATKGPAKATGAPSPPAAAAQQQQTAAKPKAAPKKKAAVDMPLEDFTQFPPLGAGGGPTGKKKKKAAGDTQGPSEPVAEVEEGKQEKEEEEVKVAVTVSPKAEKKQVDSPKKQVESPKKPAESPKKQPEAQEKLLLNGVDAGSPDAVGGART